MSFFSSTSRGGSSETPSPAGSKTAAPAAVALEVSPTRNGETDGGGGHRRSSTGTTTGEGTMTTTTTRTPHYHFLHSMILPATVKIQKELKGRKFKDVQVKLTEAITLLKAFQLEPWTSCIGDDSSVTTNNNENANNNGNGDGNNDTLSKSTTTALAVTTATAAAGGTGTVDDNPLTRVPMEDAIAAALEAYLVTIAHPLMTKPASKVACQGALECIEQLVIRDYVSGRAGGRDDPTASGSRAVTARARQQQQQQQSSPTGGNNTTPTSSSSSPTNTHDTTQNGEPSQLHRLLKGLHTCSDSIGARMPGIHSHIANTTKAVMIAPRCGVHEASMLLGIRIIFHSYLVTQDMACRRAAKEALLDVVEYRMQQLEADPHRNSSSASLWYTDCFYMVRSFVKLSSKDLAGLDETTTTASVQKAASSAYSFFQAASTVDPLALHNKILSLELQLQAIECAGPAFCNGDKFIQLVQSQNGSIALFKNCMSQCTQVAYVSQQLFLIMCYKFKAHFKDEIQAFMSNIFFRVLESENSSFTQKALVLESLRSLCNDPFLLSQIFLNYDCDFDSMNLYKDIVFHLAQVCAKSTMMSMDHTSAGRSKQKELEEHSELSLASCEVLVTILQAFLKALNIQINADDNIDTAGTKIRKELDLEEVMSSSHRRYSNFRRNSRMDRTSVVSTNATAGVPRQRGRTATTPVVNGTSTSVNNKDGEEVSIDTHVAENGGVVESIGVSPKPSRPSMTKQALRRTSVMMLNSENTAEAAAAAAAAADADASEQDDDAAADDLTGTILGFFEKKRNAEQNLELGVVKFTMDLKKGLHFFIDNEFVKCDAKAIARFFLSNKDRLDKTQMGEALGRGPDEAFIKKPPNLDPEKGGPGFFFRILHHYAMALDFTGMAFDEAIRLFLSGFRLPGEAQKIDRIMEKFAERYTHKNPAVFSSADTAFILAFSVIMLNTDLHNPSIKPERRMTLDSFIRNNRGIGENGSDLPQDFLAGIFAGIKERPFSLKEDDDAREKVAADETSGANNILGENGGLLGAGLFGTTSEERKKEKFKKEREDMVQATELLIRRKKGRASKVDNFTDTVDPAHVVKPMFDVTWGAIIGTLSQVMECSTDERSIAVCLNGFVYAIRISAHSQMSLARDTFLGSLAKFTYLGSVKELKYKNVEIIRTLINIAITDGEYLGESWGPVLQCISQLARMRMSASGLDTDESFLQQDNSTHSGTSAGGGANKKESTNRSIFARETKADILKERETTNSRIVLNAISDQVIDQVFSSSTKLSAQSLALFIEQLIAVANSEIEGDSKSGITGVSTNASGSNHGDAGPSIFSMQRLVEVADYNMHIRPRFVWKQIWDMMAKFFTKNGCHSNPMVSVFAVDALKQLSLKFLEKPEVSDFRFQRLFLQPFLQIMECIDTRQETKEVILACVDQMIHTRADNLKSGWRIFFDILMVAANDRSKKISLNALNILQGTIDKNLNQLSMLSNIKDIDEDDNDDHDESKCQHARDSNVDDFLCMCRASLSFIERKNSKTPYPIGISMRALCHAAIYADLIASKRIFPPLSGAQTSDSNRPGYTYEDLDESEALEMVLWRTIFEGLAEGARSTSRSREGGIGNLVQRGSVLALRAILLRHGSIFSDNQLSAVLKDTILPCFQEAVEKDNSPVTSITSESPAMSSLDFLSDPLPIPPDADDDGLLKFEQVSRQSIRNPRSMGPAELLLEATFTDMRNGGGGDLSEAYKFAKKDMESNDNGDQPFPDSWVSTTAPIALGTLTDLSSEVMLLRGAKGAAVWRSTVGELYRRWCNGDITEWVPCEAVVRIATNELERFMKKIIHDIQDIHTDNSRVWANHMVGFYSYVLQNNLEIEHEMIGMLLDAKFSSSNSVSSSNRTKSSRSLLIIDKGREIKTDFGVGTLENKRRVDGKNTTIEMIQLKFGILFRPTIDEPTPPRAPRLSVEIFAKLDAKFNTPDSPAWMKLLPALKLRCIAAHYLQQILLSLREEELIGYISEETVSNLLKTLNTSREFAEDAVKNEDIALAFQEAMLNDWGLNDEDMGEEALVNIARLNTTQGSAMFFLTQTAGATNGVIRFLSALYDYNENEKGRELEWNRRTFAGQYLSNLMQDIFFKFAESETKEGHKVDPNVWRNTAESGAKVAIYCTSFASVVVGLLQAMLSFEPILIERNKAAFFPMVCELVGVQSEEIRKLVRRVLTEKFGPLLGLGQDTTGLLGLRRHSTASSR